MKVLRVQLLTALDGMRGHLEGDVLSSGLRYVHAKHKTNAGVFPPDVRLALPQLDVGVPELQDPSTVDSARRDEYESDDRQDVELFRHHAYIIIFSHCFHVVLWLQGDLEDFGAVDDLLKAGGRDCLASDAVHLIKGVGLEDALIGRTNEDLQAERLLASVAMQLHTHTHTKKIRKTDFFR